MYLVAHIDNIAEMISRTITPDLHTLTFPLARVKSIPFTNVSYTSPITTTSRLFSINLSSVKNEQGEKKPMSYDDFKITDKGVAQLKHVQQQFGANTVLRILVDTGGCSGFQYNYNREQLEDPQRYAYDSTEPRMVRIGDDYVFQRDGVTVLVDDVSMPFLVGAQLDYVTEMIRSAFQVTNNPNVELACGCGTSFSKKK